MASSTSGDGGGGGGGGHSDDDDELGGGAGLTGAADELSMMSREHWRDMAEQSSVRRGRARRRLATAHVASDGRDIAGVVVQSSNSCST